MTQTIGQRLKAAREEQRLTLEKVFEATRIRMQYLQALEADDLSTMPSPVQARGYLRNYAEFLGFNADQLLEEMRLLSAQPLQGEVIGPADETAPIPQPVTAPEPEVTPPPAEIPDLVLTTPRPIEQQATESSVTVPIKAKAGRRKKTESQPQPALPEPTTKRRGRKKAEPEPVPAIDVPPEPVPEFVPPAEVVPEPVAEEQQPVAEGKAAPALEENIDTSRDASPPMNASDNIWQNWLNRLGSVLSARARRRTLVTKESSLPGAEAVPVPMESEVPLEADLPGLPIENSDEIFKEIGRELRARRELLSLHFGEVERNTHVKAHYLDALERGALDELPSTVQTRGMLSNYATFLDLDVDVLLLRFADALQARHRERNPQKPPRKPGQPIIANMPPVRTFIAGDMIFGVGMAVLLVGFAIWGVSRVMTIQSQREVNPTAPSISDVLLASPDPSLFTATPTFLPVEAFPGAPTVTVEIPTQNVNAEVQLNLVAVERTYMRVIVDGEVEFDGRVVPGNAYPFEAENQIEVLVGSGAAIRTVYNGRDLGLMGTFGQVVSNIYSATEIITPTAQPSPMPTITLTPTRTAVPTSTLRASNTPVSSATAVP